MNHFANMCPNRNVNTVEVHEQNDVINSDDEDIFSVGSLEKGSNNITDWCESLRVIGSGILKVKLDSGAHCNVLPIENFKQLNHSKNILVKSRAVL